jgi:hypothetical protein
MRRNRNLEVDVCMYAGILMLGIVVIAALCGWWAEERSIDSANIDGSRADAKGS